MAQAALGRIIAGFVYLDENDPEWDHSICQMVRRSSNSYMGDPMFWIKLKDGSEREVLAQQLHPWFPVTDTGDDWLFYRTSD